MKILFVGAEALPYVSTGGLGDVLGSLPQAVKADDPNSDIRVVLPLYKGEGAIFRFLAICWIHNS